MAAAEVEEVEAEEEGGEEDVGAPVRPKAVDSALLMGSGVKRFGRLDGWEVACLKGCRVVRGHHGSVGRQGLGFSFFSFPTE